MEFLQLEFMKGDKVFKGAKRAKEEVDEQKLSPFELERLKVRQTRESLPVFPLREELLKAVKDN